MSCAICQALHGQTTPARSSKTKQAEAWDENTMTATAQRPFISDRGFLVLPFTVTNKGDKDIQLNFKKPTFEPRDPDRIYFHLKDSDSFQQIDPDHDDVLVSPSLIPSALPTRVAVVVGSGKYSDSKFLESDDAKLARAFSEQLGNVSEIVIFIPSIHAKLKLRVRTSR
jgi:hypothetical protein